MYKKGNGAGVQLLVQWEGNSKEDSTWEDFDDLTAKFPTFQLWFNLEDKVLLQREGNVMICNCDYLNHTYDYCISNW